MNKHIKLIMLLAASFNVHATTGTSDYGYGVVSKAMGGTGVAQVQNAFSMDINPAALVFLDRNSVEAGGFLFTPRRSYSASYLPSAHSLTVAPGHYSSGSQWFGIPNIAYNKKWSEKWSTGISFFANGGLNTNFNSGAITGSGFNADPATNLGVFGHGNTGGELRQMFVNIPLSVQLAPNFSVGVGFLTLIETIKVNGFTAFAQPAYSVDPGQVTNHFTYTSFGFGGIAGALFQLNEFVQFGASYQPRITPGKLKPYQGLFANGRIEVPEKVILGTSVHIHPKIIMNLDYQFINYQHTKVFGNVNTCVYGPYPCLGTPSGAGFGFKNTHAIKLGGQWQFNENYILRAGYTYNNNPIQASQVLFNIIAPAVTQNHITVGLTRSMGTMSLLNLSFLYAPESSVEGPNALNPLQTIRLSMHQYEFGMSWTWFLDSVFMQKVTK